MSTRLVTKEIRLQWYNEPAPTQEESDITKLKDVRTVLYIQKKKKKVKKHIDLIFCTPFLYLALVGMLSIKGFSSHVRCEVGELAPSVKVLALLFRVSAPLSGFYVST